MTDGKLCPRCRVPLRSATASGTRAEGCLSCGGVMLDPASVERMTHDPAAQFLAESASVSSSAAPVDTSTRGIACPTCSQPMEPIRVLGIDVDLCPRHGTWFDRGELQQIADEARRQGGLPRGVLVAGAAASGAAALGVGLAASEALASEQVREQVQRQVGALDVVEVTADVATEVSVAVLESGPGAAEMSVAVAEGASAGVEAVAAGAEGALEVAAAGAEVIGAGVEVAGSIFGAVLEVLGSIFS